MFFGVTFYTNKLPNDTSIAVLAILWVVLALLCSAVAMMVEFCRWFTSSELVERIVRVYRNSITKRGSGNQHHSESSSGNQQHGESSGGGTGTGNNDESNGGTSNELDMEEKAEERVDNDAEEQGGKKVDNDTEEQGGKKVEEQGGKKVTLRKLMLAIAKYAYLNQD